MTGEKQAQLIERAFKEAGLDCHITWHNRKADAYTWAERISVRFFESGQPRPVKNSYMYCDTLDMCFFYGGSAGDVPYMTYAGYVNAGSPDITQGKLVKAFQTANTVLQNMGRLMEEANPMKKRIEAYADYDQNGRWRLNIEKKRGKLTLDEIKEAAREWEWDFYLLVLDCFHDPDDFQYGYEQPEGDRVELYRTELFYEEGEH